MSKYVKSKIVVDGITYKYCYKCKSYTRLDQFNKNRSKADGLASMCRPCSKKYRTKKDKDRAHERYLRHKDELTRCGKTTYDKEHYERNRDRIKKYMKKYYKSTKKHVENKS